MKRVHYLLLGLAVSLCVAAVGPGGGGTVIPGGAANVALLNGTNVFTGTNRFSSVVTATNTANTFAGNSATFTNLHTYGTITSATDAYFNGARVGLGAGNNAGNFVAGVSAAASLTSGLNSVAVGNNALGSATTAASNTAVGWEAGRKLTSENNVAIGAAALHESVSAGGSSVAVGYQCLYYALGSGNVGIGASAGARETGSNKFYIGNVLQATEADDRAYSLLYGTFSGSAASLAGQKLVINGNVGIGTTTPAGRLNVKASTSDSSATDFQILNSSGANLFYIRNDQIFSLGSGAASTQLSIDGGGAASGIYSPAYSSAAGNVISYKDYNGNTRMKLDMSSGTDGKLGIGTTSPGAILHTRADSTSAIVELLRLQNGTAGGNTGNGGEITFRDGNGNKVGNVTSVFTGSAWVLKLGAYANESTVTVGTGLTIGTAGTAVTNYASATATLDFASIAAHDYQDLTITVTGAGTNDTVTLGLPATVLGGVVFNSWVSTTNTVTVRCNNFDAGPKNPDSATYRVGVTSH